MVQSKYCSDAAFLNIITEKYTGVRLDHFLVQTYSDDFSRSQIIASIKTGHLLVNDTIVKAGYRLKKGDVVTGFVKDTENEAVPVPQKIVLDILYEDPFFLAINKPPGLVVHPGSGNRDQTLVNGLLYHFSDLHDVGDVMRPGIVHRLDKDTSGVILVARSKRVHAKLVQEFKDRNIEKKYLTLVHGVPQAPTGRIVAPIGRHKTHRQKMAIRHHTGRYAVSNWQVKERFEKHSLLEVLIETGRTHQIRVHLAHLGHPVAGDRIYGSNRKNSGYPRQLLHAWKLSFKHPEDRHDMEIEAPVASDFKAVLEMLRASSC